MNVALPLERMSSKERMTSRGKECGGSTKQKEPEKKNEKMGRGKRVLADARGRHLLPLFFFCQPPDPSSRARLPAGEGGGPQEQCNRRHSEMGHDGPLRQPFITKMAAVCF